MIIYMQVEAYTLMFRIVGSVVRTPPYLVLIRALLGGTLLGLLDARPWGENQVNPTRPSTPPGHCIGIQRTHLPIRPGIADPFSRGLTAAALWAG